MIPGANLSLIEMLLLCFSGPQERKPSALLRGGQRRACSLIREVRTQRTRSKGSRKRGPARMIRPLEISYRKEKELTFLVSKENKETATVETDAGVRKHFRAPQS